jgi:8-oxo-dGTP pyrophosphatase MutT (NUDIX family)
MAIRAVGGVALRGTPEGAIQVLLIRKRGGLWTLPKGRVKRGEADESALVRELREETGLDCLVGEPVSEASYKVIKAGRPRRKVVVYYIVWPQCGELRPGTDEGIEAVRWVDVSRALKRIGRPRLRAVLRSALTLLAS